MSAVKRDPQIQALARGLEILDLLLDAGRPITGGELAREIGLHESSVSRILQTLIRGGYVSKVPGGNVPALRMLRFARVTSAFPMITHVRPVLEAIAAEHPGHHVNLCAYGHGELTYLVRCQADTDTITGFSFPLHGSSAAMRLLVDLPDEEALAALQTSRRRHGWTGGPELPTDEVAALTWARDHVHHDVLVLRSWHDTSTSGAIPLVIDGRQLVLAIGGSSDTDPNNLHLWLHEARRRVEQVQTDHRAHKGRAGRAVDRRGPDDRPAASPAPAVATPEPTRA